MSISFASDNASGVLPEVMEALQACNTGHSVAYGDDDYTRAATQAFKETVRRGRRAVLRLQRHRR